jgi:zinc protease
MRRSLFMLMCFLLMAAAPRSSQAARKKVAAKVPAGAKAPAGTRTVLLPSATNPLVAIRLYFDVGADDDPPGKEGLASLTATMLGEGGTKERTYAEVLDALYPMAAHIRDYGDKDSMVLEGTVHRDNLAAFSALLAAQILEPRFSAEDFTRNKQDALDYLTKTLRGNDDENLGKQSFAASMYKGHPYGRPTAGTVLGLTAITLDDVKRFYAEHFTRDRLIVGLAGGYPDDFARTFTARFDALPAHGRPRAPVPTPPATKGNQVVIIEKEARANAISLGHPLKVTRADDDFYPLTVARSYLGEHRTFNGVLMIDMRQKRGLNYGDYAYIENFIQDGGSTFPLPNIPRRQQHFEIWIRPVPPVNAGFALRQAIYETDKLIREGIPAAGFEATRTFLLNYCNLWAQDVSRRLGYAIDAEVYGKDVIAELKARLPKMKKADVDKAIRKHLHAKDLSIAIVSEKGEALRQLLTSGKPTPIVYDTKDTAPDVMKEDKIIEKFPLGLKPGSVKVVPVDQMFEK